MRSLASELPQIVDAEGVHPLHDSCGIQSGISGLHSAWAALGLGCTRPGLHSAWAALGLGCTRPGLHSAWAALGLAALGLGCTRPGLRSAWRSMRNYSSAVSALMARTVKHLIAVDLNRSGVQRAEPPREESGVKSHCSL